jgi:hypothetical protein
VRLGEPGERARGAAATRLEVEEGALRETQYSR